MVNGGRPRLSAAIGGAMATSYQRCGGQTSSGDSPLAAPSTAASTTGGIVARIEGLRRLAGGDAQARRAEAAPGDARQPMSCRRRCRADHGNEAAGAHPSQRAPGPAWRRGLADGRGAAPSACSSRVTSSSGCAADRVTRSRLVPTGTVGGRMAGTHSPSSSSAAEASRAACSLPRTIGMIGLGWPGGAKPASMTRSISAARRPVRAAPSAERSDAEGGQRSRGVGRRRRGREDVGAGPVDEQVDDVPRRRHETTQRAQRLGQRADPHDRSPVPAGPASILPLRPPSVPLGASREVGAEDGVGLIEDQEGVVAPAQRHQLVERGDVPIHGEDRVGHDDRRLRRRPAAPASASSSARWPMSRWRYTASAERESRQPSMMLAWFSSSESTRTPGPPEAAQHAEVGGEPGREADGGLGPLPLGQRPLELAVDGAGPGHQARGARPGAPAVERLVGRRHHGRVRAQSEIVVGRERHRPPRHRARPPAPGRRTPGASASGPRRRPAPARPGSGPPRCCRRRSRATVPMSDPVRCSARSPAPHPGRRRSAPSRPR